MSHFYTPWKISLSLDQGINRLLEILCLCTTECVHVKAKYANDKHEDIEDDSWEGYSVHLHYQPAIDEYSADNLVAELKRSWPTINSLWMSESNLAHLENRKPNQHLIWIKFWQEHFLEFPNVVRLYQIMVTNPANTSPLERSYTKLQLVAAKRRNHFTSENLEVLYLLAAINHLCLLRGATEYDAEIKKTRVIHWHIYTVSFVVLEAVLQRCSYENVFWKICSKFKGECPCTAALSKSHLSVGVLLGICCIFLNTLS